MGLLAPGTPLDWPQTSLLALRLRQIGVAQFLSLWKATQNFNGHGLRWGDEIEYLLLEFDHLNRIALLSLTQHESLTALISSKSTSNSTFQPEFGRFMLESTPLKPYGACLLDCLGVESDMSFRRRLLRDHCLPHRVPLTLASFPRLGAPGTTIIPAHAPRGPVAQSLYLPDQIISQHVRFPTLASNIRQRRGSKVAILVPIHHDLQTPRPFRDPTVPLTPPTVHDPGHKSASPERISVPDVPTDHIYLDAMGFGMGCCCLQVTLQAWSVSEARELYDALVPIAPILMSLSAAAPIYKGFLSDVDSRWDIIAGAVDDRTDLERGVAPGAASELIPKSRYGSVSLYISNSALHRPEYNDIVVPINKQVHAELVDQGIDPIMARHIAHLFIRDPLVIFSENLHDDQLDGTDHFENLQSTNWQSVRFKPPPSKTGSTGWRVEFRSMEVQLTDFENAAYSIFVVLLTRAILSFGLNFYIPISMVDENMNRAQKRDSCRSSLFWFRKNVVGQPSQELNHLLPLDMPPGTVLDSDFEQFTINEIINGKPSSQFPGLMGFVKAYMNSIDVELMVKKQLQRYLDLISLRASGKLVTMATYIRHLVQSNPSYRHDSLVTGPINYDLIKHLDQVETGQLKAEMLLGDLYIPASISANLDT